MYVVSKGGTYGVVARTYCSEDGTEMVVIKWGRFGWLSPVRWKDCAVVTSRVEAERKMAEWEQTG
jgi:hypothetical protein